MSYACFTVSYCWVGLGHYVGNYYVDMINRQFDQLFHQTNEFAKNILHTNNMYLKASVVKFSTFWRKMGGWGCGSQNGPLRGHCDARKLKYI